MPTAKRSSRNFLTLPTSYLFSRTFHTSHVFSCLLHVACFLALISRPTLHFFPAPSSGYVFLLWVVIGSFCCLRRSDCPLDYFISFFTGTVNLRNPSKFIFPIFRKGEWALLCAGRLHNKKFQVYFCTQRRGGSVTGSASLRLVEDECWGCGRLDAWWFLGTAAGWGNVIGLSLKELRHDSCILKS